MDALLHQSPAVHAVKQRGDEIGLKALIAEYRSAPTTPLKPYSKDSGN
jgi:hypothetical protein